MAACAANADEDELEVEEQSQEALTRRSHSPWAACAAVSGDLAPGTRVTFALTAYGFLGSVRAIGPSGEPLWIEGRTSQTRTRDTDTSTTYSPNGDQASITRVAFGPSMRKAHHGEIVIDGKVTVLGDCEHLR